MAGTVTIRTSLPADAARVSQLMRRSFLRLLAADYPPSTMVLAVPRLITAQPRLLASGRYFVAEAEDGRLMAAGGYALARAVAGRAGDATALHAEIRHVATDPDALRRGIGRGLMRHAMARAEAEGARHFHCLSTRTAEPVYAALGFVRLGAVTVPLGPGIDFPAIAMRRDP